MPAREIDLSVVRDARLMLEKAARILSTLEHECKLFNKSEVSENHESVVNALANIHAAEARLK